MSDQVMKLFEALSDVDEELLERCNRKENGKNAAARRLFQRYGKAMAAGICLIVVGAVSWGGYNLKKSSESNTSGSAQSMEMSPAALADMAQSITTADGGIADCNGEAGSAAASFGNGAEPAAGMTGDSAEAAVEGQELETETAGIQATSNPAPAASTESLKQQEIQNLQGQTSADRLDNPAFSGSGYDSDAEAYIAEKEYQADKMAELREQENALVDSRQIIPWEEACALKPFDSYLPDVLPKGYEPFSARRSSMPDLENNVIFKWCDGEHIFYLSMTQGEVVTKEDLEKRDGLYEYLAEDFRKELIPDPLQPAGEPISFTLYYGDGMQIRFYGYVTADEMWEVVESISK